MSDIDEILAEAAVKARPATPTARWFEEHPLEAEVFLAVITAAKEKNFPPIKTVIDTAKAKLGGPPTGYIAIGNWFDAQTK